MIIGFFYHSRLVRGREIEVSAKRKLDPLCKKRAVISVPISEHLLLVSFKANGDYDISHGDTLHRCTAVKLARKFGQKSFTLKSR